MVRSTSCNGILVMIENPNVIHQLLAGRILFIEVIVNRNRKYASTERKRTSNNRYKYYEEALTSLEY